MLGLKFEVKKRLTFPRYTGYLVPSLSIVAALLAGSVLLLGIGINPLLAYREMFLSAFGSKHSLGETIVKATPLILCGLGTAVAFLSGFWNIGAEGQLQMGALAATWAALTFSDSPGIALIPLMIAVGFLSGGAWGMIPAFLKVKLGADEILTTLMMNYIAVLGVFYFIYGPWRDPMAYGNPRSPLFSTTALMPRLPGTRVHLTVLLALLLAVLCYVFFRKTKRGLELRVIGENPSAAKYAGINIFRNLIFVMLISGGISGIAGMGEVAGVHQCLPRGFSPGYGYTAIIVTWLAKRNPIAIPFVAFLLGGLINGGYGIQMEFGIPIALVNALQALILFFVLGFDILHHYEIIIRRE